TWIAGRIEQSRTPALKQAGIEKPVSMHELRHSYASTLTRLRGFDAREKKLHAQVIGLQGMKRTEIGETACSADLPPVQVVLDVDNRISKCSCAPHRARRMAKSTATLASSRTSG